MEEYGYIGMFFMSLAASSVLPLGSEWLLAALLVKGLDPVLLTATATCGNYLGAVTTYYIGYFGSDFLTERILKISPEKRAKVTMIYEKYGRASLLFSWLPVIGDPLCFVSGVMKYNILPFSALVLAGKGARYAFLTYITLKMM